MLNANPKNCTHPIITPVKIQCFMYSIKCYLDLKLYTSQISDQIGELQNFEDVNMLLNNLKLMLPHSDAKR